MGIRLTRYVDIYGLGKDMLGEKKNIDKYIADNSTHM